MPTVMIRLAYMLLLALSSAGMDSFAQRVHGTDPPPQETSPPAAGERWSVTTVQEFYGLQDREPSKRERKQELICHARGTVSAHSAANTELPGELKSKCWLSDKRTEARREQTKYACSDGMSVEVATRQEADGSLGSQVVVNAPDKGGISITRTMRRVAGACDPAIKSPSPPAQPAPPAKPLVDAPLK